MSQTEILEHIIQQKKTLNSLKKSAMMRNDNEALKRYKDLEDEINELEKDVLK